MTVKFIAYMYFFCYFLILYIVDTTATQEEKHALLFWPSIFMYFLIFYEMIQAKYQGWRYLTEFWNYFDILGFISFFYMYELTKPIKDEKTATSKTSISNE